MLNYRHKTFPKLISLILAQIFLLTGVIYPESITNKNISSLYIQARYLRVPLDSSNGYARAGDMMSKAAAQKSGTNTRVTNQASDSAKSEDTGQDRGITLALNAGITEKQVRRNLYEEISQNLWFEWNYKAKELFKMMDPVLWSSQEVDENPSLFLKYFGIDRLKDMLRNSKFMDSYNELMASYRAYMDSDKETWVSKNYPELEDQQVVYSSFEFGVGKFTQNLQSGGLGALSGDHLKEMSDKGFRFIGVGLGYKYGYFTQRINSQGGQEEVYSNADFSKMPKQEVYDKQNSKPLILTIPMYNDVVYAKIWEVMVGRGKLYLLDTDIEDNGKDVTDNWKRRITKYLYSKKENSDDKIKFHQAYILGIGEALLLDKLDVKAGLYHFNESHSGFAVVGLIKNLMSKTGLTFEEAAVVIYYMSLFTIHTPIPAGNWEFPKQEPTYAFNNILLSGEDTKKVMSLGDKNGILNMAQLLLNLCGLKNGVSDEHGSVSREQWPGYAIGEVLNGVSIPYWQAPEWQKLIGAKIRDIKTAKPELTQEEILNRAIDSISDKKLFDIHMVSKKRLIGFVRKTIKNQRIRNNDGVEKIREAEAIFNENVFTIGIARRFAPYKRSDWLFSRDFDRIKRILLDAIKANKPIQVIFAGKAHPEEIEGQEIIKRINGYIRQLEYVGVKNRVVFLENYNLDMAHYLEQGCDVWLSHPTVDGIPEEASATSGEKAALNGIINAGVPTGFMRKDLVHNINAILFNDMTQFYSELELNNPGSAINQYYGENSRPSEKWISMMRESMRTAMFRFGTDRMMQDYAKKYYIKEVRSSRRMKDNDYELAKNVAAALKDPGALLKKVNINNISPVALSERVFKTNGTYDPVEVEADIKFEGDIPPEAVEVSIIFKQSNRSNYTQALKMEPIENKGDGIWRYKGVIDTLLRTDFIKDLFKSDTRNFRLDQAVDCSYQIRVRPIISFSGPSNWAEKRSEAEGNIRILPNEQAKLASNRMINGSILQGIKNRAPLYFQKDAQWFAGLFKEVLYLFYSDEHKDFEKLNGTLSNPFVISGEKLGWLLIKAETADGDEIIEAVNNKDLTGLTGFAERPARAFLALKELKDVLISLPEEEIFPQPEFKDRINQALSFIYNEGDKQWKSILYRTGICPDEYLPKTITVKLEEHPGDEYKSEISTNAMAVFNSLGYDMEWENGGLVLNLGSGGNPIASDNFINVDNLPFPDLGGKRFFEGDWLKNENLLVDIQQQALKHVEKYGKKVPTEHVRGILLYNVWSFITHEYTQTHVYDQEALLAAYDARNNKIKEEMLFKQNFAVIWKNILPDGGDIVLIDFMPPLESRDPYESQEVVLKAEKFIKDLRLDDMAGITRIEDETSGHIVGLAVKKRAAPQNNTSAQVLHGNAMVRHAL